MLCDLNTNQESDSHFKKEVKGAKKDANFSLISLKVYVPPCNPCPKPLPLNAYAHYYSSGCWGVVDVCLPFLLYLHSVCELEVFTETYTGSGLYFKWSAGSGPNLLHWVPGLFNFVCNTRVNQRAPHPPASVSMHVCNLQFVKLG